MSRLPPQLAAEEQLLLDWVSRGRFCFDDSPAASKAVELARRHFLLPFLHATISESDERTSVLRRELDAAALLHEARVRRLLQVLDTIFALLTGRGIRGCVFKGLAAGQMLYGNPFHRHCGDIDLLVGEEDRAEADRLLVAAGFQPRSRISGDRTAAHYLSHDRCVNIDLHTEALERRFSSTLSTSSILARTSFVRIEGLALQVGVPSPEDTTILACIHGMKHLWCRLLWIVDIAQALKREELCWETVVERASSTNNAFAVVCGARLASGVLKAPLRDAAGIVPISRNQRALIARLEERLFFQPSGAGAIFQNMALQMQSQSSSLKAFKIPYYRLLSRAGRLLAR